jgi:hypothetical protein
MTPAAFQPSDTWDRPQAQSAHQHGHKGDKKSNGNVFRLAARAGINRLKTLTAEECTAGAAACCKLIKENASKASHLRWEHLQNRYELASDLEKPAKCIKIKKIIKRKEQ